MLYSARFALPMMLVALGATLLVAAGSHGGQAAMEGDAESLSAVRGLLRTRVRTAAEEGLLKDDGCDKKQRSKCADHYYSTVSAVMLSVCMLTVKFCADRDPCPRWRTGNSNAARPATSSGIRTIHGAPKCAEV